MTISRPTAGELRPYQVQGIAAVADAFEQHRSTLVVWPTGGGKTVLMAHVAEHFVAKRQRVLVLAHRQELIDQAVSKIQRWTGLRIGIEKAQQRAIKGRGMADKEFLLDHQPVVVGSIQTLRPSRLERFARDEFGLVLVDEAHHALAATWRRVLDYFEGAKVLGVSATPDRGDERALGQIFETVAHEYSLQQAIREGYLVPIRQHAVHVDGLDLSRVRRTAGDLNAGDLERILIEEEHLQAVANPIFELSGERPTLTFATSVEHAMLLANQITRRADLAGRPGKRAEWLSGETDPEVRKETLARFARGEFQHLVGCALFLEGFDEPRISCVAMARPTSSRALYAQAVGRGTRLSPETGKTDLLILDMVGNAGKHALVSAVDIWAGDMTPMEKAEVEKLKAEQPGMRIDELTELAKERAAREAEKQAKLRERRNVVAGTNHRSVEVDPFAVIGGAPKRGRPGTPPATPAQLEYLKSFKFEIPQAGLDRSQAGRLIDTMKRRRTAGLCTYPQAKTLAKFGVDAKEVSFDRARELIDAIAANNWRGLPEGI